MTYLTLLCYKDGNRIKLSPSKQVMSLLTDELNMIILKFFIKKISQMNYFPCKGHLHNIIFLDITILHSPTYIYIFVLRNK